MVPVTSRTQLTPLCAASSRPLPLAKGTLCAYGKRSRVRSSQPAMPDQARAPQSTERASVSGARLMIYGVKLFFPSWCCMHFVLPTLPDQGPSRTGVPSVHVRRPGRFARLQHRMQLLPVAAWLLAARHSHILGRSSGHWLPAWYTYHLTGRNKSQSAGIYRPAHRGSPLKSPPSPSPVAEKVENCCWASTPSAQTGKAGREKKNAFGRLAWLVEWGCALGYHCCWVPIAAVTASQGLKGPLGKTGPGQGGTAAGDLLRQTTGAPGGGPCGRLAPFPHSVTEEPLFSEH
jgi:hypothetical protein